MKFIELHEEKDGGLRVVNVNNVVGIIEKKNAPQQLGTWVSFVDGDGLFFNETVDEIMMKIRGEPDGSPSKMIGLIEEDSTLKTVVEDIQRAFKALEVI